MKDPSESENIPLATTEARDRRRPGRKAYRNPHLIALLRRPLSVDSTADEVAPTSGNPDAEPEGVEHGHELAAARGIGIALVIGASLWLVVFLGIRYWRLILGMG